MSWLSKEISFSQKKLHVIAYLLLFVPYYLFIFSHLKLIYSLPVSILLTAGLYFLFRNEDDGEIHVSRGTLFFLFASALFVSLICGQGGYLPQGSDSPWRNAVLHDLIVSPWPVTYHAAECTAHLVYYYNFWLIPALIGKIFLPLGMNIAIEVGFAMMPIISAIYLSVIFLILSNILKKYQWKHLAVIFAVFLLFSGMDFVGYCIRERAIRPLFFLERASVDYWSCAYHGWQYNSFLLKMVQVYNQAIPAWLCTALFLKETGPRRYGVITAGCLVCAPFPCVGLTCIASLIAVIELCKRIFGNSENVKSYLAQIFSAENILFVLSILPVMPLFLLSNQMVSGSPEQAISASSVVKPSIWVLTDFHDLWMYLIFILLECGILLILVYRYNKTPLYAAIAITLLALPTVYVISHDFWSRASIPALFVLMFYCVKFFLCDFHSFIKTDRFIFAAIMAVLLLGFASPMHQAFFSCLNVERGNPYRDVEIGSFANLFGRRCSPCTFERVCHPKLCFVSFTADQSFFFSHLARKSSGYADSMDNRKICELLSEQPAERNILSGTDGTKLYIGQYLDWLFIITAKSQMSRLSFQLYGSGAKSDSPLFNDELINDSFVIETEKERNVCVPFCISRLPDDNLLTVSLDGKVGEGVSVQVLKQKLQGEAAVFLPQEKFVILDIGKLKRISRDSADRTIGLYGK